MICLYTWGVPWPPIFLNQHVLYIVVLAIKLKPLKGCYFFVKVINKWNITCYNCFEILKSKKKKMYCAFVDLMNAFDTVWRAGLWHTMLLNNINGKMYDVIFNMYCNIQSCIVFNKCKSDFFACDNGIWEGDNLSLFFIFLILKWQA